MACPSRTGKGEKAGLATKSGVPDQPAIAIPGKLYLTRSGVVFYGPPLVEVFDAMSLDSLKLLEAKIGEFVDQHERVRQEHDALLRRLQEKEEQLEEAASQLKQYEQERSEIKARLARILERLESLDLT